MTKDLCGSPSQCLKMLLHIREQKLETAALMIMRDHASRDAPEPLDTIGIWIIRRRIDQREVLLQFGEHAAHEQGPRWRVSSDGRQSRWRRVRDASSESQRHGLAHRRHRRCAPEQFCRRTSPPGQSRRPCDYLQAPRPDAAAPSFPRPDARERRMEGKLHLILEIEVSIMPDEEVCSMTTTWLSG